MYTIFEDIDETVDNVLRAHPELGEEITYTDICTYVRDISTFNISQTPNRDDVYHNVNMQMANFNNALSKTQEGTPAHQKLSEIIKVYNRIIDGKYIDKYISCLVVYKLHGMGYESITVE
ncbi:MAG: hypothetical protein ACRDD8_15290 [Bacteroidales bacterium]